ncbi:MULTISPECIES: hypothetical protein [unclassified Bradyrhizobium]|uniref:hypothetical protein n=1 Tax=unclassified Bradyrhizobium TaxID=2631580 RepID=UPI001FFC1610|nr:MULTISPECIES: hypothetical protein [unclassified Bradyrhizobium]MCK1712305.1 hypothetical protein [Bradyrhizobium sp. 143]MCK1731060.1 hypothetical protein [Bradyrhizobium sp. 142]
MTLLAVARRRDAGELEAVVCRFVGTGNGDAVTRLLSADGFSRLVEHEIGRMGDSLATAWRNLHEAGGANGP